MATRAQTSGAPPLRCKAGFALEKMVYPRLSAFFPFRLVDQNRLPTFMGGRCNGHAENDMTA
jgi:hypothetical protein